MLNQMDNNPEEHVDIIPHLETQKSLKVLRDVEVKPAIILEVRHFLTDPLLPGDISTNRGGSLTV